MKNPLQPTLLLASLLSLACATTSQPAYALSPQEEAAPRTLFTNVNVWDGRADSVAEGVDVLVEGQLIVQVGAGLDGEGATVVDGGGRTLMPGLIDMHSHLAIQEGMLTGRGDYDQMALGARAGKDMVGYLDQGFTTARDAGGNILGLAKAERNGLIDGPRLFPAGGFLSPTGGHGDTGHFNDFIGAQDYLEIHGFSYICDSPAEITKAARMNLRAGATQIKIMAGGGVASEFDPLHIPEFNLAEMKAAVDVATDYGTYVMAHAYHDLSVNRCIDAGVKVIEHNFLVSEETVMRMKKEGVALSIQAVMSLVAFGDAESITFFSADQKAKATRVNRGAGQMMKWARKHDLIMVTGGDMFGPAYTGVQADNVTALVDIMEWPPVLALKTATGNAGEVLSWSGMMNPYKEGKIGMVAQGYYADVIIVDGNPLEDVHMIDREHVRFVMKDGTVYKNSL
jgi:imidazolonepropionase-like amidohydrolase